MRSSSSEVSVALSALQQFLISSSPFLCCSRGLFYFFLRYLNETRLEILLLFSYGHQVT